MNVVRSYFDIEKRMYSSNIVVRIDVTLDKKGKDVLHKTILVVPVEKKAIGDDIAEAICEHFKQLGTNYFKKQ